VLERTFANYTSNDLRKGAFGKDDGHNPRMQVRVTGSCERGLLSKGAAHRPFQIPPILIVPTCLGMYCPYSRKVTCRIYNVIPRIPFPHGHITFRSACLCGAR